MPFSLKTNNKDTNRCLTEQTNMCFCCYPPAKSKGYSFGVVLGSVRLSVRPHFLSVQSDISVPIGQI